MTQERLWNFVSAVALVVVAAAWLWFLFAYASLFSKTERAPPETSEAALIAQAKDERPGSEGGFFWQGRSPFLLCFAIRRLASRLLPNDRRMRPNCLKQG
jgi:hypothetical protein